MKFLSKANHFMSLISLVDAFQSFNNSENNEICTASVKNYCAISGKTLKVVFRLSQFEDDATVGGFLKLSNGTTFGLDGSGVPVIWDLKDMLNFSLDIHLEYDWGKAWDAVAEEDVDLGVPLRTIETKLLKSGGLKNVVMLQPVLSMPSVVYFKQPITGMSNKLFVDPFKIEAWFWFLLCSILCVIVCYSIYNFKFKIRENSCDSCGLMDSYSYSLNIDKDGLMSDVIMFATTIINGRDNFSHQRHQTKTTNDFISRRLAVFTTSFFSLMIFSIYTAKIVAFMSVKNDLIKTPEDLLINDFIISSYSYVHVERIFKNVENRNEIARKALETFEATKENAVRNIFSDKPRYALMSHPDGFFSLGYDQVDPKRLCEISSFSAPIKSARSMYLKRGSPFRAVLNLKILHIIETGLNHRHQTKHARQYEYKCVEAKASTLVEVSLQQILPAFLILFIGAGLALWIEIFAKLFRAYKNYLFYYYGLFDINNPL